MADESDAGILNEVQSRFEVQITEMPDEIDVATYSKEFVVVISTAHLTSCLLLVENR